MPTVVDSISGAGWIRGCLPVLNRIGQSVPPVLSADRVRRLRRKRAALIAGTLCMCLPFVALAVLWAAVDVRSAPWVTPLFMTLYLLFFSATGIVQMVQGTLQGKLIRAERRGRLLSLGSLLGAVSAIGAAAWLLPGWLSRPDGGFHFIFAITAAGFAAATGLGLLLREPSDESPPDAPVVAGSRRSRFTTPFREAWAVVRGDSRFRRATLAGVLVLSGMFLFPHYQALARARLQSGYDDLLYWLIAQNLGGGLFGLVIGRIADRSGNRLALRYVAFLSMTTPVVALILGSNATLRPYYGTVFFLVGLVPVCMKVISNYALELTTKDNHPRYLSTMKLCFAVPFLASPVFGLLVDAVGFDTVFILVSALVAAGGMATFRMVEPRNAP